MTRQKGFKHSEITKQKMSEAWNKRPPISEETRIKMSKNNNSCKGDKHPAWKGGISFEPYCPKFNDEFRERVRAFFGYQCQFPGCGRIWHHDERKLAVHHVNYNKNTCCDVSIPLFVPLCSLKCHNKTNHKREFYKKIFTELIITKYKGQCYLPMTPKTDDGIALFKRK